MPTIAGEAFAPGFRGRVPGMSSEDLRIYERWLPGVQGEVLALYFDVGLGAGKDAGPGRTERERYFWLLETQKRADCIAVTARETWLVEFRARAQPNALGRLLVYDDLYAADPLNGLPVVLWIVTDLLDGDTSRAAERRGVRYRVV